MGRRLWGFAVVVSIAIAAMLSFPPAVASAASSLNAQIVLQADGVNHWKVVAQIDNDGENQITGLIVEMTAPAGMAVDIDPFPTTLAKSSALIVHGRLSGAPSISPASLIMQVSGKSIVSQSATFASVDVPALAGPIALSLGGNSRATDTTPAELIAIISNSSYLPVQIVLSAATSSGKCTFTDARTGGRVTEITVAVPPRSTITAPALLETSRPIRPGKTSVVFVARQVDKTGTTSASKDIDVSLGYADVLPGVVGTSAAIVVPGLVGIWLWVFFQRRDRKRLGPPVGSIASEIWANKAWLFAAAALSLVVSYLCAELGLANILDAPDLLGIAYVSFFAGVLCSLTSIVVVKVRRLKTPLVVETSSVLDVLSAATRHSATVRRQKYLVGDKDVQGIIVQRDGDYLVLSPPVWFSTPATIDKAVSGDDLCSAVAQIRQSQSFDGRFAEIDGWIARPTVVKSDIATLRMGSEAVLVYRDG